MGHYTYWSSKMHIYLCIYKSTPYSIMNKLESIVFFVYWKNGKDGKESMENREKSKKYNVLAPGVMPKIFF